jgi:hypothetical protein
MRTCRVSLITLPTCRFNRSPRCVITCAVVAPMYSRAMSVSGWSQGNVDLSASWDG